MNVRNVDVLMFSPPNLARQISNKKIHTNTYILAKMSLNCVTLGKTDDKNYVLYDMNIKIGMTFHVKCKISKTDIGEISLEKC